MRKSYVAMMTIMIVACGALLLAGNRLLAPLAQDAEKGRELTQELGIRGDVAPGSAVKVLRVRGSERRLAPAGKGILLELTPSDAVRSRETGLSDLALRASRASLRQAPDYAAEWVEVVFEGLADARGERLRTLVRVGDHGALETPTPAPAAARPAAP